MWFLGISFRNFSVHRSNGVSLKGYDWITMGYSEKNPTAAISSTSERTVTNLSETGEHCVHQPSVLKESDTPILLPILWELQTPRLLASSWPSWWWHTDADKISFGSFGHVKLEYMHSHFAVGAGKSSGMISNFDSNAHTIQYMLHVPIFTININHM